MIDDQRLHITNVDSALRPPHESITKFHITPLSPADGAINTAYSALRISRITHQVEKFSRRCTLLYFFFAHSHVSVSSNWPKNTENWQQELACKLIAYEILNISGIYHSKLIFFFLWIFAYKPMILNMNVGDLIVFPILSRALLILTENYNFIGVTVVLPVTIKQYVDNYC